MSITGEAVFVVDCEGAIVEMGMEDRKAGEARKAYRIVIIWLEGPLVDCGSWGKGWIFP